MKAKSLKKLLVIKEICSRLKTFRPSNPGGSQEHISLITNSFSIIRSTPPSRPNKVGLKCPSTKSFFNFNEIWYVDRGR